MPLNQEDPPSESSMGDDDDNDDDEDDKDEEDEEEAGKVAEAEREAKHMQFTAKLTANHLQLTAKLTANHQELIAQHTATVQELKELKAESVTRATPAECIFFMPLNTAEHIKKSQEVIGHLTTQLTAKNQELTAQHQELTAQLTAQLKSKNQELAAQLTAKDQELTAQLKVTGELQQLRPVIISHVALIVKLHKEIAERDALIVKLQLRNVAQERDASMPSRQNQAGIVTKGAADPTASTKETQPKKRRIASTRKGQ